MQQQPRLPLWFLLVNWALIVGAFVLGLLVGDRDHELLPKAQLEALELVHHEILKSHVSPPTRAQLVAEAGERIEKALVEAVGALDSYSRYVPPRELAKYLEQNTGHYQGIGCEVRYTADAAVLFFPMPGSPAEKAGVQPGDLLLAVDGKELATDELRRRAAEFIRGPADTDVRLRVQRGDATRELVARRAEVTRPCVRWTQWLDRAQGLGYLHLSDFHPTCEQQVLDAIEQLEREQPLRGLVFDLRFDGGGDLNQCIEIARAFVPSGIIVQQKQRGDVVSETHMAAPAKCRYGALPLVVLQNELSASASEVLAGALQDHQRAAIVGMRSYGKGYVNTVYTWEGHDFRLKLTTGRYVTPSGRNIDGHFQQGAPGSGGIAPDVEVAVDAATKERSKFVLAESPVPPSYREAVAAVAQRHQLDVPEGPTVAKDPQLAQALTTLRERVAAATK
jgi:carboxyl-terminal processing protease